MFREMFSADQASRYVGLIIAQFVASTAITDPVLRSACRWRVQPAFRYIESPTSDLDPALDPDRGSFLDTMNRVQATDTFVMHAWGYANFAPPGAA